MEEQSLLDSGLSLPAMPLDTDLAALQKNIQATSIGQTARSKIESILQEVHKFTDNEKLYLYLQLPSGPSNGIKHEHSKMTASRADQMQAFSWIRQHLEEHNDTSLPKQEVYDEYKGYCENLGHRFLSAADFGKLMKNVFPNMKARRLGTRGNSKYCYSGLRKKALVQTPSLPSLEVGKKGDPNECGDGGAGGAGGQAECLEQQIVGAACSLVCEWAQKVLSRQFDTLLDLAQYLVNNSCVPRKTSYALVVMSPSAAGLKHSSLCQPSAFFKPSDGSTIQLGAVPGAGQPVAAGGGGGGGGSAAIGSDAKQQLQRKIQQNSLKRQQEPKQQQLTNVSLKVGGGGGGGGVGAQPRTRTPQVTAAVAQPAPAAAAAPAGHPGGTAEASLAAKGRPPPGDVSVRATCSVVNNATCASPMMLSPSINFVLTAIPSNFQVKSTKSLVPPQSPVLTPEAKRLPQNVQVVAQHMQLVQQQQQQQNNGGTNGAGSNGSVTPSILSSSPIGDRVGKPRYPQILPKPLAPAGSSGGSIQISTSTTAVILTRSSPVKPPAVSSAAFSSSSSSSSTSSLSSCSSSSSSSPCVAASVAASAQSPKPNHGGTAQQQQQQIGIVNMIVTAAAAQGKAHTGNTLRIVECSAGVGGRATAAAVAEGASGSSSAPCSRATTPGAPRPAEANCDGPSPGGAEQKRTLVPRPASRALPAWAERDKASAGVAAAASPVEEERRGAVGQPNGPLAGRLPSTGAKKQCGGAVRRSPTVKATARRSAPKSPRKRLTEPMNLQQQASPVKRAMRAWAAPADGGSGGGTAQDGADIPVANNASAPAAAAAASAATTCPSPSVAPGGGGSGRASVPFVVSVSLAQQDDASRSEAAGAGNLKRESAEAPSPPPSQPKVQKVLSPEPAPAASAQPHSPARDENLRLAEPHDQTAAAAAAAAALLAAVASRSASSKLFETQAGAAGGAYGGGGWPYPHGDDDDDKTRDSIVEELVELEEQMALSSAASLAFGGAATPYGTGASTTPCPTPTPTPTPSLTPTQELVSLLQGAGAVGTPCSRPGSRIMLVGTPVEGPAATGGGCGGGGCGSGHSSSCGGSVPPSPVDGRHSFMFTPINSGAGVYPNGGGGGGGAGAASSGVPKPMQRPTATHASLPWLSKPEAGGSAGAGGVAQGLLAADGDGANILPSYQESLDNKFSKSHAFGVPGMSSGAPAQRQYPCGQEPMSEAHFSLLHQQHQQQQQQQLHRQLRPSTMVLTNGGGRGASGTSANLHESFAVPAPLDGKGSAGGGNCSLLYRCQHSPAAQRQRNLSGSLGPVRTRPRPGAVCGGPPLAALFNPEVHAAFAAGGAGGGDGPAGAAAAGPGQAGRSHSVPLSVMMQTPFSATCSKHTPTSRKIENVLLSKLEGAGGDAGRGIGINSLPSNYSARRNLTQMLETPPPLLQHQQQQQLQQQQQQPAVLSPGPSPHSPSPVAFKFQEHGHHHHHHQHHHLHHMLQQQQQLQGFYQMGGGVQCHGVTEQNVAALTPTPTPTPTGFAAADDDDHVAAPAFADFVSSLQAAPDGQAEPAAACAEMYSGGDPERGGVADGGGNGEGSDDGGAAKAGADFVTGLGGIGDLDSNLFFEQCKANCADAPDGETTMVDINDPIFQELCLDPGDALSPGTTQAVAASSYEWMDGKTQTSIGSM
ncbi:DNA-binding protein RFX7-like [Lampetra planeri]